MTSSRLASRAINSKHQSLQDLAHKHIQRQKQVCASPIKAQTMFRQVLPSVSQTNDLLGTARAWMPSVKTLLQSCSNLQLSLPDRKCDRELSPQTHELLSAAAHYQTSLHEDGLIDTSELYWRAIDSAPVIQQLLIYGYFQPQAPELAWIDALAAPGSVIFLPLDDAPLFAKTQAAVDWLIQSGWEWLQATTPSTSRLHTTADAPTNKSLCETFLDSKDIEPPVESAIAYSYGTFESEIRGTLSQVKALRSAGIAEKDIAIVARDERSYGPKLLDIAWEYDLPLRALYATPLVTTRLGAWVTLLLTVVETQFPFEETAKLLSHPLCSNPDSDFWGVARQAHPEGFSAWREIANNQLTVDISNLERVRQSRRRDTWVEWLMDVFRSFSFRSRCARWPRESVAFNNLRKALVEVSKPEEEQLSWLAFKQQIEDLLESVTVPAQPGRGGVELHSPASMMGGQYAHVFVVGMADSVLPPVVSNDPVLDFFERVSLSNQGIHLPSATDSFQKEALDFYFLLQAATGQLTFSYPKLKDRKEQLPSPYLAQLNIAATTPPELPISSQEELRRSVLSYQLEQQKSVVEGQSSTDIEEVLAAAIRAFEVESHRESAGAANEYDGIIDQPFDYSDWTFSVSQLTNLGQCPFKWFADKVLTLGNPIEADSDLSPSLRGNLYHQVAELLVQAVQENPQLAISDLALLKEKFLEAEKKIDFPALPAWEMRREDHMRKLATVLRKPDFWPEDAEPVALEEKFKGEWEGFKVTGRVDRIDRTPNGLVLIDYKTSAQRPKGLKDSNGKANIDLQLQLYREAAATEMFPDETVTAAQYFSLTKGKELKLSSKAPQHELPDAIASCKTALNKGHYPVQPDVKRDACRYCDFDLVCRKGSRLTRKENSNGTD
ncbi:MAG: PD-(D/E)XK nuclease family protein [Cyanobacteria bacterium P01_D01_bin.1]